LDEAMNWFRNNEVKPGDVDVDVLRALTTFRRPMPKVNMSPLKEEGYRRCDELAANNDPNLTTLTLRLLRRLETCCEDARYDPVSSEGLRYG
jgi:hypothetical protein